MKTLKLSKFNAILFDSTRCIGCRSCEEACMEANKERKRTWNSNTNKDFRKPPDGLSADKWLHLSYHKLPLAPGKKHTPFDWDDAGELMEEKQYAYFRHACMHCVEPACVNACIVGALVKDETGATVYDPNKCMGCRYCMIACPFQIPKWEWHEAFPYIRKCSMCIPRQKQGKIPACVENCPGNEDGPALVFGGRRDLLFEAEKRIYEGQGRYYPHVFGRTEVGGTGVLYIMSKDLSPEKVGLPRKMGHRSIPDYSEKPQKTVPYWVGGLAGMLVGLNWLIQRREKLMKEDSTKKEEEKQ